MGGCFGVLIHLSFAAEKAGHSTRMMAEAGLIRFQSRFKELLEASQGSQNWCRRGKPETGHVCVGQPCRGLRGGSDPLEGHGCGSKWDFPSI